MAEPTDSWFKDGLRFRCNMCGHCCTGTPGYVWLNDAGVREIAAFLGETTDYFLAWATRRVGERLSLWERENGDCIFYNREKGCTIYPVRPLQCRTWPFWESNLEYPQAWKRTCEACPGSGQGDLISADEIVRRMRVFKL